MIRLVLLALLFIPVCGFVSLFRGSDLSLGHCAQSEPNGFEGQITISLRSTRRARRRLGEFVL